MLRPEVRKRGRGKRREKRERDQILKSCGFPSPATKGLKGFLLSEEVAKGQRDNETGNNGDSPRGEKKSPDIRSPPPTPI